MRHLDELNQIKGNLKRHTARQFLLPLIFDLLDHFHNKLNIRNARSWSYRIVINNDFDSIHIRVNWNSIALSFADTSVSFELFDGSPEAKLVESIKTTISYADPDIIMIMKREAERLIKLATT